MDEEMIGALREILPDSATALLEKLDAAEAMAADSQQQKALLHEIWLSLSSEQREAFVESDDVSDESGDNSDAAGGKRVQPQSERGGKVDGRSQTLPPPAKRPCSKAHALTAVSSKPADYKRLEGNEGNCDICDADYKYTVGAYHCDVCKNWDCCVRCGSTATATAPDKSSKNKCGGNKR